MANMLATILLLLHPDTEQHDRPTEEVTVSTRPVLTLF